MSKPADSGARSAEELATALDQGCKQSDFAKFLALVHPDERGDVASGLMSMTAMQCAMLNGMASVLSDSSAKIDGFSSQQAACKGMAEVAARHGSPFELWQGVMTASSEQETEAISKKAGKTLDGADVVALMRELHDAQVKAKSPVKMDFPGFGHGVDSSALRVEGDTARVPVRGATGFFALVRVGERWFVSLERSEPGQTSEQAAEQQRGQATEGDQKALREAVSGSWSGPWGRLEFGPDGAATFETRTHCATEPARPWQAQPGTCKPVREQGKVELSPYEIGLTKDDFTSLLSAYVDSAGRLHAAMSVADVGKLDGQRNGQVKLAMFRTLHVQGDSCRLEDSMKETNQPVGCAFVKEEGVDVLRIDIPTDDGPGPTWLVYLPEQGLLVPPVVYATAYERASK